MESYFQIVGIQKNVFKFEKPHWRFNEEVMAPIYEPNTWRQVVTVIDEYLYNYNYHDGKLSK